MKSDFPQNLKDRTEYRDMVRWFSPKVFLQTLNNVIPSTLFGQFADRRLVHAALDSPIDKDKIVEECCGGEKGICDGRSEFWVDYVADLGDGWNSTYAIAYLIGQKSIDVVHDGQDLTLPRADCLIMGGDEIYPYADKEDYHDRMERPYKAAFPRTSRPGATHPPVYMIPGNHDWYDGLTLFLARFCRGRDTPLGSWNARQRRSYFATHLGNNWWIWGFDSQLGEDVDKPQADYFSEVGRKMKPNAKVIICASVPTWLKASLTARDDAERERFYRGLDYIANIVRNECEGAKVPLVLAGDLHHYTRYVDREAGTNFVNSGGGGAFLHPTHCSIDDEIDLKWTGEMQTLEIGRDGNAPDGRKAIYPPQDVSRDFALRNFLFFWHNKDFCYMLLGPLYFVCSLMMLAWSGYGGDGGTGTFLGRVWHQALILGPTPVFLIISLVLSAILVESADVRFRGRRYGLAIGHSVLHLITLLFGTAMVSLVAASSTVQLLVLSIISMILAAIGVQPFLSDILYFLVLAIGMVVLGFVGGFWWGVYMTVASYFWGDEGNNAFSALGLDCYKNFLRIKIEGDMLTVYPIGVDNVPSRGDWEMNPKCVDGDQNTPVITPTKEIGYRLIEAPILIDLKHISPIKAA